MLLLHVLILIQFVGLPPKRFVAVAACKVKDRMKA